MSDQTFNQFVASGTTAERLAFVPDPPSPASGPDPGYVWWDTDLQAAYAYDVGTAAWVVLGGGGSGVGYAPVSNGAEPVGLLSNGAGELLMVPYAP